MRLHLLVDATFQSSTPTDQPDATMQQAAGPAQTLNSSFPFLRDPAEALTQQWEYEDLGGFGDCFFRCVAAHLSEATKPLTKEEAQRDGSWLRLRLQTIQHISSPKHRQRLFSDLFAPERVLALYSWKAYHVRPGHVNSGAC